MGSDFTNFDARCHGRVPLRGPFRGQTSRKQNWTLDRSSFGTRDHGVFSTWRAKRQKWAGSPGKRGVPQRAFGADFQV